MTGGVRGACRALAALAGFAAASGGCGSVPASRPAAPAPRADDAAASTAWLTSQPQGCALGQSGPTLKPTDALREARRRARASLITAIEKVSQKAVSVVGSGGAADQHHEVILEQAEGWVRRSTIVALWYDDRGTGPNGTPGTAYAAACLSDTAPPATRAFVSRMEAHRAAPAWVYGVASPSGQLCAAGVSGPTMDEKDAPANAEASARAELAEGIAAHVKLAAGIFDDETLVGAVTDVPESCRTQAAQGRVVATWTDARGVGPVPFAGTSYAFVCASL